MCSNVYASWLHLWPSPGSDAITPLCVVMYFEYPACFVLPSTTLDTKTFLFSLHQNPQTHSSAVRLSSSCCLLNSSGFSRISIPGPMECAFLVAGKTYEPVSMLLHVEVYQPAPPTFVPPHPNLKAASCANSSPKPSISPLTNGRNKLMAAPRSKLQNVGGL